MSTFAVRISVAGAESGPYEEMQAIVDTGAFYSWIPRDLLEGLGIRPHGVRTFILATGESVEEDVGRAWVRIDGRVEMSIVVFARPNATPLLGAVTLEEFALAADPVNERLVPMPRLAAYRVSYRSAGGDHDCG